MEHFQAENMSIKTIKQSENASLALLVFRPINLIKKKSLDILKFISQNLNQERGIHRERSRETFGDIPSDLYSTIDHIQLYYVCTVTYFSLDIKSPNFVHVPDIQISKPV